MLHYVHVRTELARRNAPTDEVLNDLNAIIRDRGGVIIANRQILTSAIHSDWVLDRFFDDEVTADWEHPKRGWGPRQRAYFSQLIGVSNPFQFGEQRRAYGRYCIGIRVPGDYLAPSERILGLVDAGLDDRNYYCTCHYAEVVYTTAGRLVCMMCGQMHCVLMAPLAVSTDASWTEAQWHGAFDANGVLLDHQMRIPFVEYQEVYRAKKLWLTDAWHEVSGDIEFLARGDPDEVARWRAGQPTIEDFLEAGWSELPQPPTPARQMEEDAFGVDIAENAALAANAAASDLLKSQTHPAQLRSAVLNAFHAIELILKVKLEMVDVTERVRRSTNPQVLSRLKACGVAIQPQDLVVIAELRALRNKLQHSEARYGFRDTRALLERAFGFIDRFTTEELGWWLGDIVEQPAWDGLLTIASIQVNASAWSDRVVADWVREDGLNSVEHCPTCARHAVLRRRSQAGLCAYCRRIPINKAKKADCRPPLGSPEGGEH